MKKVLLIALFGSFVLVSCNNQKAKEVTEEPAVEAIDSVEVFIDSTATATDTLTVDVEEEVVE